MTEEHEEFEDGEEYGEEYEEGEME